MLGGLFGPEDAELSRAFSVLKSVGAAVAPVVWVPMSAMMPAIETPCLITVRSEVSPGWTRVSVVLGMYRPGEGFSVLGSSRPAGTPVAWALLPPPYESEGAP